MFTVTQSPTGHFTLVPFPGRFFETPPPFGAGALLLLNRFDNNSASLRTEHMKGISIAAAQAGGGISACEIYGITDRSGSESLNKALSTRRANAASQALKSALGLGTNNLVFANGLGERFADEYHQRPDNERDADFRGVACYLWESIATATDPFLRIAVAFASPPGSVASDKLFLAPLHMGRLRTQPPSPFA